MTRDLFTPTPRPAPAFPNWKPTACACGEPHPSFSATGPTGPWRCLPCHKQATGQSA